LYRRCFALTRQDEDLAYEKEQARQPSLNRKKPYRANLKNFGNIESAIIDSFAILKINLSQF
jgi:hypothetical protein